ncbi:hypothetical protein TNCV_2348811 [Trichonephila clavipes]|uniref:Uncharacterized protein n=1 Tax=Trichonephila clavipes TaxID=2585209 RepID=A0A8X6SXN6_TRICX|nr:hypothetical protein TNCV_2348811 [Trichonephila clavipes]
MNGITAIRRDAIHLHSHGIPARQTLNAEYCCQFQQPHLVQQCFSNCGARPLGSAITLRDNYFIGRHSGTGSTFTTGLVSSRTIRRRLSEGHLGLRCPLRVLPLTPPPSTPPFGVVPGTRNLDCSGMEPGRL